MLYNFKLGHNVAEAIKNISCVKGESADDVSKQMILEISLGLQEPLMTR